MNIQIIKDLVVDLAGHTLEGNFEVSLSKLHIHQVRESIKDEITRSGLMIPVSAEDLPKEPFDTVVFMGIQIKFIEVDNEFSVVKVK